MTFVICLPCSVLEMVDCEHLQYKMLCNFCNRSAAKTCAICRNCRKCIIKYKQHRVLPKILQLQQILQKQKLKSVCKTLRRKLRTLEDEIYCVTDRVTISKQALLQRNHYNVASGLKRIIRNTVRAKFVKLKKELGGIISEGFVDTKDLVDGLSTSSEESEREIKQFNNSNNPGL